MPEDRGVLNCTACCNYSEILNMSGNFNPLVLRIRLFGAGCSLNSITYFTNDVIILGGKGFGKDDGGGGC